jgi:hypothetical protein
MIRATHQFPSMAKDVPVSPLPADGNDIPVRAGLRSNRICNWDQLAALAVLPGKTGRLSVDISVKPNRESMVKVPALKSPDQPKRCKLLG